MHFLPGLGRGLVLTPLLLMVPTQAPSQVAATDTHLARIVCQAYSAADQKFLGRVLVLEQTSTKPLGASATESGSVDGARLLDGSHSDSVTHETPFRLRIYNDVSLISNLSKLVGHDVGHAETEPSADPDKYEETEEARYAVEVRRRSLSIGRTDEALISGLLSGEASRSSEGHPMDYGGAGSRTGNRFAFRPIGRYRSAKGVDIFLNVLRGLVDTGPGAVHSPEDGPYFCKAPVLVPEGTAIVSLCREGNEGQVDIFALAEPGTLVRRIQRALEDHGFDPGPVDGILGPRTSSALWAWKVSQGFEPGGFVTYEQLCEFLPDLAR